MLIYLLSNSNEPDFAFMAFEEIDILYHDSHDLLSSAFSSENCMNFNSAWSAHMELVKKYINLYPNESLRKF